MQESCRPSGGLHVQGQPAFGESRPKAFFVDVRKNSNSTKTEIQEHAPPSSAVFEGQD